MHISPPPPPTLFSAHTHARTPPSPLTPQRPLTPTMVPIHAQHTTHTHTHTHTHARAIPSRYGWEWETLEVGFLIIFLCPLWPSQSPFPSWAPPPHLIIWLLRWSTFRLLIGAGMSKLGERSSACWRDLSCKRGRGRSRTHARIDRHGDRRTHTHTHTYTHTHMCFARQRPRFTPLRP